MNRIKIKKYTTDEYKKMIADALTQVLGRRCVQYLYETLNESAIVETFKVLLNSLKV